MTPLDLLASAALTLVLHASVLLGAAWLLERFGALRHPGWAEFAWRAALLGALVSTPVHVGRLVAEATPAVPVGVASPSTRALHAPDSGAVSTEGHVTDQAPSARTPALALDSPRVPPRGEPADSGKAQAAKVAGWPAEGFASPRFPSTLMLPDVVALLLLSAWLLCISAAALRLCAQAVAVAALSRRARRDGAPPSGPTCADAENAAAILGVRMPSLHVLDGIASPMLLPGRRLLLPAWTQGLSSAQRRALFAHELAHLQRGDPAWRVLQRLAALPLCFHPLAWHALARLDALAEDACDAHAARVSGSGRPLAECLAACVAHAHESRALRLAVAMADRPGPVVRRVRNLLEESPMSDRPVPPALRRAALVAAVVAAIALPGLAVTTFAARAFADGISTRVTHDGDHYRYSTRRDGYRLVMEVRGKVAFNDAETDVASLGPGARLTLEEEKDGVEREVRIFGKGGAIQHQFRVDGDPVPFDAQGRAWLAAMLPAVMRETGIDADARGQRILARGGTPALLEEIALITSDHARARYLGVLFAHATLDPAQTAQALDLAADIESDFELRNALQAAVDMEAFDATTLNLALEVARSIGSDFELAELLSGIAESYPLDDALLPAWRQAFATIGSDFERRRVIDALIRGGGSTAPGLVVALDAATAIRSDFELRQVLEAAAPRLRGESTATAAWFSALEGVQSDFEQREALMALMASGPVDLPLADAVLQSLDAMQSDFEAGQILAALAARMPDDAALRERYRASARRLGDFERGRAEKALDRFAAN